MKMSQTLNKLKQIASKFYKPGESTSSRPGWMVRDSHLTHGGLRMTNTTAGTFTELKETSPQRVLSPLFPHSRLPLAIRVPRGEQARMGSPKWRHPLMFVASLTLLSFPFFLTTPTHATSSSITINITNAGNLTINVPPSAEGTFAAGDAATVNVSTTHAAGYNLTVKANSSTDLVGTGSNTNVISSLPTGTSIDADTFSNKDNTQYNNKWGYKPQKYNSATNTTFRPSPSTSGDTIDSTNNADNNSYTVSIGARVTNTTPIDSYSNTFVFAVTGNPTSYTITYNQNTTDTVTNMPSPNPYTGSASGETATNAISATVPERDGYNFKGWCSTTTSDATCSGTTYNPDGDGTSRDLTLNQQSATNSFTIYAMWESARCDDTLYNCIAIAWANEGSRVMTNDTNTSTGIQAAITTANSGVFKYDSSVFGASSDASNDNDIYYYRGILDTTVGSYGSDGDNAAHPNTVLLDTNGDGADTSDTCWRIVRTTGSGGVKMVYSGKWTGSTCANATTAAQVTTQAFAEKGTSAQSTYWYRNIHYVGYTFNNNVTDSTTDTSVDTVFGSNSNYSTTNTTSSAMKKYIEDNWFSTISSYESILEPSAGYCNDRTAYSDNTTATALTTITPYKTSDATMYFGAYGRNINATNAGKAPSLTCSSSRNVVDLYTTSSASNGNKQLSKPAALLTADEVSFAGSGRSTASQGSSYHANSYLRSGSYFWLLSPYYRYLDGNVSEFSLYSNGYLGSAYVFFSRGVRPAISLASETSASSGSGTATDPWVVLPPPTMQDFAAGTTDTTCSTMSTGDTITLTDSRDGEVYLVGKLTDGKCWMLDNLRLDPADSTTLNNITASNTNALATTLNYFKNGGGTTSDQYPTAKINNEAWTSSSQDYYSVPMTINTYKDTTTTSYGTGSGKIGVYYNYCAASAGSYCYGNGTSQGTSSGNATEDLCPAGWRMPTGSTSGEYQALYTAYSSNVSDFQTALSTPLSGYFFSGSANLQGNYGSWWSSTRSYSNYMYSLRVSASDFYPAVTSNRNSGYPLRCIAQ